MKEGQTDDWSMVVGGGIIPNADNILIKPLSPINQVGAALIGIANESLPTAALQNEQVPGGWEWSK